MKIAIISLGCPKNQVDADVFCHALIKDGHTTVGDPAEADIIIINTCAFIESARKEAVDNILDVAWLKENRHLKGIIVTGCLAERYREEIFEEMPEGDAARPMVPSSVMISTSSRGFPLQSMISLARKS